MIEYNLKKENNLPITLESYEDISKIITSLFPQFPVDKNKGSRFVRESYGINGEAFHVYYKEKNTQIFLPSKNKESLMERIEVLGNLKLEEIRCQ